MHQNKNKLVIFDLDGTLIDTSDLIITSLFETLSIYTKIAKNDLFVRFKDSPYNIIRDLSDNTSMQIKMQRYWTYYKKNLKIKGKVYPCIKELLQKLSKNGSGLGIVTSLKRKYAINLIEFYLKVQFDVIISYEDTLRHKPEPDPIILAIKDYNVKNQFKIVSAIYIGDSINDIQAGKNAGITTGLAAWSINEKEIRIIEKINPDYIFNNPLDILKIDI